jgi:hypothetical protein
MERVLSSLLASLVAAPLFYFATAWLVVTLNRDAQGPDAGLGVAYLSVFGGFIVALIGFFLVWFLTNRFLMPQHLRLVQLAAVAGLVGWGIVYMNFEKTQPQRLDYGDLRAVLEVELRATKAILGQGAIDSLTSMDFIGGTNFDQKHPDQIREDGDAMILPWETLVHRVGKWEMRVFLQHKPVLFQLDLPQRPEKSTDWSGWAAPVQYQDVPIPDAARQGLTLRYRFRIKPYSEQ